jgi:uncharacterized protein YndB with AHSA1/START domain
MARSIKHQFFFPHSPETVWEYLTKSELLEKWIMKNNFQPIVGFEFQFQTKPIPSLDFDGVCHCKVIEIVPFQKLSYSWRCGPGEGKISLDSTVVWELKPTEKGTELFLDHSGFEREENTLFYQGMTEGWLKNLQKMAEHLNTVHNGTSKA